MYITDSRVGIAVNVSSGRTRRQTVGSPFSRESDSPLDRMAAARRNREKRALPELWQWEAERIVAQDVAAYAERARAAQFRRGTYPGSQRALGLLRDMLWDDLRQRYLIRE